MNGLILPWRHRLSGNITTLPMAIQNYQEERDFLS